MSRPDAEKQKIGTKPTMNLDLSKCLAIVSECGNQCCSIATGIESTQYWSGNEEITSDVYQTTLKMVAHLMFFDGDLKAVEANFVRLAFHVPEEDDEDIKKVMLYYVTAFPDFFVEAPAYFKALAAFDNNNGTNFVSSILSNLRKIAQVVIFCSNMSEQDAESAYSCFLSYSDLLEEKSVEYGQKPVIADNKQPQSVSLPTQSETPNLSSQATTNMQGLMNSLDKLVGLEKVKSEVVSLTNLIKVRKMREEQKMPVPPLSMHLVFTGNPGTGKTTVARLLAEIYQSLGVLSTGQLIEADRSAMVAGYLGQTALKTRDIVKQAIGGVLFIDEAYSLTNTQSGPDEYGQEAISTLIKLMEDNRDNLVVIVAGYPNKMENFLKSNPGLRSRFNKFIHFEDYSATELYTIFERMCQSNGYLMTHEAAVLARSLLKVAHQAKNSETGNGRFVRNFFETIIGNHANRIVAKNTVDKVTLVTIDARDLAEC